MRARDFVRENINFYDRFGHDSNPQALPYTVEVRDRETGGKKLISIQAVSAADARERARDRGYRVVRVVSQDEQGVAEGGPFSYGAKKPRKGSVADLAAKKRQEQERGKQPIEPRDQRVGVARVTKGIQEGFMDTLKGAARELTRDSLQKKIKQAWENTFWPKHIEPALNRIQIDGQPFRRMVLGEPRVIENDRSKNAILKQYTVNIVFPIDPEQWAGDEIRYLEGQLRDIENGDWNPKVHGLGLVSFDQPMKSFQYTKGPVPDLVIPVRITSLDINRSLVGEQGVAEASWTAAASMHAATRKRDPQPQKPKHDFRVGDDVVTKKGSKPGTVVFVDGEKIHVKGTNPYYPDHVTHHTASELKKDVAEGHADQQRTIVKRNGQPVGEVGIDRESSPGVGQYYMKHYASGTDNSGYDSREEALGDLRHIMKQSVYGELREQGVAEDQITEVSKDYYERERAADEMGDLIDRLRQDRYRGVTPEIIKRMRQLVTVTGRARTIYGGENHDRFGSAGALLDMLGNKYREAQIRSGTMPEFQGRANTSYDMAQQIAQQTRGQYEYYRPRTWTTGYGQRYRDPEDYVVYPTEQALDDAWQWLESRGKKVHYYDNFKSLTTAIQIGRYVVELASFTQGAFSKEPETTHRISVRSAKSLNQGVRSVADITDQQAAALSDIAATKSAKAIEGIRAIMAVLQGEEDIKRVIDSSKKIDPRDKAKLDAIIAAAGKNR